MNFVHQIMTDGEIKMALVVGCLMCLDFFSGVVAALVNGAWRSQAMREGLLHKCSLILCMLLGVALNAGQRYMDLGITVPAYQSICVYIALMEAGSTVENVCKANPNVVPNKLKAVLGLATEDNDSDKEGTNG